MASISTDSGGFRRILFVHGGKRDKIHLGNISSKSAATLKAHIEEIIEAKNSGRSLDDETAKWLRKIDDMLHAKLVAKGLASQRQVVARPTLGPFITAYIEKRSDIKPNTLRHLKRAEMDLLAYFGADKPLAEVTEGDADEFRLWLRKRLGDNTVRRMCGRARQLFRAAVKRRLIETNPFGEMRGLSVRASDDDRVVFVSRADAAKVLEACPNTQWRLIFALSRFGGLRCPSEHMALRWGDVDWQRGRLTVHSPKTEHHEGKAERVIPIFPELRPYLDAAWAEAPDGAEFIIEHHNRKWNPATHLARIIKAAGLTPWPKLTQNLRSTRQTELSEKFPAHVVCAWLGNSQAVAQKHYLQVTDDHFEAAAEATARQTAQTAADNAGPKQTKKPAPIVLSDVGGSCPSMYGHTVPPEGLEPSTH